MTYLSETILKGVEKAVHTFYPSGAKHGEQHFVRNKYQGLQSFWYEDGTLKTLMNYSNGLLDGKTALFYPDGSPKREIHYSGGLRFGPERQWNERGILVLEAEYGPEEQLVGTVRRFYESGLPREERVYHPQIDFFDVRSWNSQGALVREGTIAPDLSYLLNIWNDEGDLTEQFAGRWDGKRMSMNKI